ncbi:hypothetical protein Tco_1244054 [Tanacetum coccineum]
MVVSRLEARARTQEPLVKMLSSGIHLQELVFGALCAGLVVVQFQSCWKGEMSIEDRLLGKNEQTRLDESPVSGVTKIVLIELESIPLTSRFIGTRGYVVLERDKLPLSIRLDFRARLDGGRMYSGHLELRLISTTNYTLLPSYFQPIQPRAKSGYESPYVDIVGDTDSIAEYESEEAEREPNKHTEKPSMNGSKHK